MQLIKKTHGIVSEELIGLIDAIKNINGQISQEDYINVWGLKGFIQDLTQSEITERLDKPVQFGLPNTYNIPIIEIKIDY